MKTQNLDVVYCLKPRLNNEELRYSLRSLENFPHRHVWMFGGMPPSWVKGVHYIPVENNEKSKWANTRKMLEIACKTKGLSANFVWFNDDFFVLAPIQDLRYHYDGTLMERAEQTISSKTQMPSRYGYNLMLVSNELEKKKQQTRNFELHCPIIYNKKKMLACLKKYKTVMPRSLYCNEYNVRAIENGDYKIDDLEHRYKVGDVFVSTADESFRAGEVGRQIRGLFPVASKYEDKWAGLSRPPVFGQHRDLRFL